MQRAQRFPTRLRLPGSARAVLAAALLLGAGPWAAAIPQFSSRPASFAHAERMREALEGRPEQQRTRGEYERVLNAYRAIYHGDPGSPKADASIAAVADLLAEEGRVFQDDKALRDAIGQYEFLRTQYPGSRFRFSALLTEGEIYQYDLDDLQLASATYREFVRLYPHHPLAEEAHAELRAIRHEELASARRTPGSAKAVRTARNEPAATREPQRENETAAARREQPQTEERTARGSGSGPAIAERSGQGSMEAAPARMDESRVPPRMRAPATMAAAEPASVAETPTEQ